MSYLPAVLLEMRRNIDYGMFLRSHVDIPVYVAIRIHSPVNPKLFGGIMALPQLTDEQRKAALEKAAAARHARAELREKIKKGEVTLESVLNSDDPIASRMKVSTLIESLPGYGKAKAAKIMDELGISATRRVQGLGVRQREQLLEQLSK